MLCNRYFLIFFLIFSGRALSISAQEAPPGNLKPTIFKYSENDSPLAFDDGFGTGIDNTGLRVGIITNIDVYHILAGYQYNVSIIFDEQVTESTFLLGYLFRCKYIMWALASGISRQKFRCTSGMNSECYGYIDETINATPLNFQADWIITDSFALGMNFNQLFSPRKNVTGVLISLKFGSFRNIF